MEIDQPDVVESVMKKDIGRLSMRSIISYCSYLA